MRKWEGCHCIEAVMPLLCSQGHGFESGPRRLVHKCMFSEMTGITTWDVEFVPQCFQQGACCTVEWGHGFSNALSKGLVALLSEPKLSEDLTKGHVALLSEPKLRCSQQGVACSVEWAQIDMLSARACCSVESEPKLSEALSKGLLALLSEAT